MSDHEYNQELVRLHFEHDPETVKKMAVLYIDGLDKKYESTQKSGDHVAHYRIQAELEDIEDIKAGLNHWDGPRTDDPPENWS
jgi:hypothetical protein